MKAVASITQKALPENPYWGPPLTHGLGIKWPNGTMITSSPIGSVLSKVGSVYTNMVAHPIYSLSTKLPF